MKTFLLNIPKRLRIESQKLDVKATLCDKSWIVFNDEGIKQLFIFQPDGSLFITTNGIVSLSSWLFIPANKSIIITSGEKSIMFHPAFVDDVIFALEQDGCSQILFMIDETNKRSFSPQTLTELQEYFNRKEKEVLYERNASIQLEQPKQPVIEKFWYERKTDQIIELTWLANAKYYSIKYYKNPKRRVLEFVRLYGNSCYSGCLNNYSLVITNYADTSLLSYLNNGEEVIEFVFYVHDDTTIKDPFNFNGPDRKHFKVYYTWPAFGSLKINRIVFL